MASPSSDDQVARRAQVIAGHLRGFHASSELSLSTSPCLQYSPPEFASPPSQFNFYDMRKLMDGHNLQDRDWLSGLMIQSKLFNPRVAGGRLLVSPDYNQSMEQQREMTMKRIQYLLDCGVFQGWLTDTGPEIEMRKFALHEVIGMYDHSLAVKLGVHYFLWYVLPFADSDFAFIDIEN